MTADVRLSTDIRQLTLEEMEYHGYHAEAAITVYSHTEQGELVIDDVELDQFRYCLGEHWSEWDESQIRRWPLDTLNEIFELIPEEWIVDQIVGRIGR